MKNYPGNKSWDIYGGWGKGTSIGCYRTFSRREISGVNGGWLTRRDICFGRMASLA